MNIPVWIKPAAYGAIVGGIIVAIVGFSWGGWVTGGTARTSASAAADASRTDLAAGVVGGGRYVVLDLPHGLPLG